MLKDWIHHILCEANTFVESLFKESLHNIEMDNLYYQQQTI